MTAPCRLRPASELDLEALADLFTRSYEGYAVPMHVDAGAMAFMQEAFDHSPADSFVAWDGEQPVGVAMLGVRAPLGWVGGVGVVSAARRRGIGEQLMRALLDRARALALRELALEVMVGNDGARLLYERLGFRTWRMLEVLTWQTPARATSLLAQACAPREARARIVAARRAPEPWQRSDATLDRLDVSTPALRALTTPGGDAVYRVSDGRASILQLHATSETSAGVLLDTLRSRPGVNAVRFLNVPADDVAAAALRARGAELTVAQHEMRLNL